MHQPTVSVITPVYNGERFIRRTIESVLGQTYKNVEYIVVDGASTDGTRAILQEYEHKISRIISEPDTGMYDAINKGMKAATGDILCYLNADDMFFPDTIELIKGCFEGNSIDLCFGNCLYVDENERELFRYDGVPLSFAKAARLGRIPFAQQTAFWTSQLFRDIGGFDSSYKYVADTKFLMQCLRATEGRRLHLRQYLSMFRLHNDGFSSKVKDQMTREHHLIMADLGISPDPMGGLTNLWVKWKNRNNFLRRWVS